MPGRRCGYQALRDIRARAASLGPGMVIGEDPPFLFVHIPKTAGVSISAALAAAAGGSRRHPLCLATKHETAEGFIARHGRRTFKRYFSFAVVRHPVERLISHFAYLKTNPRKFPEMAEVATLDAYVDAIARADPAVIRSRERVMAQWRYVCDAQGALLVDQVIRLEQLDRDFPALCGELGLAPPSLSPANASDPAWKQRSPDAEAFARRYYARDFELFGYV